MTDIKINCQFTKSKCIIAKLPVIYPFLDIKVD